MEKRKILISILVVIIYLHVDLCAAECGGSTCGECLKSGPSCGWCADEKFDDSEYPRCQDFNSNTTLGKCFVKSIVQPSSSVLKEQTQDLTDNTFMKQKKVILALRPGATHSIRVVLKVPQTIRGKKEILKAAAILPKKGGIEAVIDSDCDPKKKFKKAPHKMLCKKLKKGTMINLDIKVHLPACLEGKKKRRVKLRVVIGKKKQAANIIVNDLCSCKCVKREKAKKCKFNGKAAIGKCTCDATSSSKEVFQAGGGNVTRKEYPNPTEKSDCPLCTKNCDQHGQCIECMAFMSSPMPRTMCRRFCNGQPPEVRMIDRFENDSTVCKVKGLDGCLMKFRQIERGVFEVASNKVCPQPANCGGIDTCMSFSGQICNGKGNCVCGKCECSKEAGYSGPTCEECSSCKGMCGILKPCVECYAFQDFSSEIASEEECTTKCGQYGKNMKKVKELKLKPSTKECSFTDSNRCIFNFYYQRENQPEILVLEQKVCSDGGWFSRKRRSPRINY